VYNLKNVITLEGLLNLIHQLHWEQRRYVVYIRKVAQDPIGISFFIGVLED
jgi:hypothetical protein